jgi:hypothetical protein
MSKNEKIFYTYYPNDNLSYFEITHNGIAVAGSARCHPEDVDMVSERTGLTIAEARANIRLLKVKKRTEIQPKIDVLRHLLTNIESSKYHDPKAYESKMLRSQLSHWEKQLEQINNDIIEEEKSLKEYINQKDKLYNRLRARNK